MLTRYRPTTIVYNNVWLVTIQLYQNYIHSHGSLGTRQTIQPISINIIICNLMKQNNVDSGSYSVLTVNHLSSFQQYSVTHTIRSSLTLYESSTVKRNVTPTPWPNRTPILNRYQYVTFLHNWWGSHISKNYLQWLMLTKLVCLTGFSYVHSKTLADEGKLKVCNIMA